MPKLLDAISKQFYLDKDEVKGLIRSAPFRYKVFPIPKRKPGEYRIIAQPAREVKVLQRWLIKSIFFKNMHYHSAAAAYIPKRNIRDNAAIHVKNSFLLKMDFKDFFPSIKPKDFRAYLESINYQHFSEEDIDYAINILFWRPKGKKALQLSIGAPSSPLISNLVMLHFDQKVDKMCKENDVRYTRYADDLTFSTNEANVLNGIYKNVQTICRKIKNPLLAINYDKTVFASKKHRRRVTGLILSNDKKVSLGRDKKRNISAMIHHFTQNKLDINTIMHLRGLLAFAMDIEPDFVARMKNKYGAKIIDNISKRSF